MSNEYRIEKDSMGEVKVPQAALTVRKLSVLLTIFRLAESASAVR